MLRDDSNWGDGFMRLRVIELNEAQRRFEGLAPSLQVASMSPAFAAADARRSPALRCIHVALEYCEFEWMTSVHLQPFLGRSDWQGAISPYGYGGILTTCSDRERLQAAWALWQQWCCAHGVVAELGRFHPHLASEAAFFGRVHLNRQTVSIDLRRGEISAGFNPLTKRKINRARRHEVLTRWSRNALDWERFVLFYREAMVAMDARPFYLFPDSYFEAVRLLPQSRLLVCELDGEWLSAGIYLFGGCVAEYHLGASSPSGKSIGTPYLMQCVAAETAQSEGLEWLYLGGGTDTREDNSLLFYKLGFSRITRSFYVGEAVHDPETYWALAAQRGYSLEVLPPRVLLD